MRTPIGCRRLSASLREPGSGIPPARLGAQQARADPPPIALATPAGLEPATCGLEVRCSIQLSYGAARSRARAAVSASRRCGGRWRNCRRSRSAAGCGGAASARRARRRCRAARRRRPPPRGVAKRSRTWLFMSLGAGPAHQRVDRARVGRHELEHPVAGLGLARLHRAARRLVDLGKHAGTLRRMTTAALSPIARARIKRRLGGSRGVASSGSSAGCEGARGGVGVRTRPTTTVLLARSL